MNNLKTGETIRIDENYDKFLIFEIGSELYGVEIDYIKEVIEFDQNVCITHIPLTPDYIRGVMNLRGEVTPVIDLNARFFKRKGTDTKLTCVVITEIVQDDEKTAMGVMIDAVNSVMDIPENDIEKAPEFGAKIRADFIKGIGKINNKFVILLDINRVLDIKELGNFSFQQTFSREIAVV